MDYRKNVMAVLDTNLPQIKNEIKEVIADKMCEIMPVQLLISKVMLTDRTLYNMFESGIEIEETVKDLLVKELKEQIMDNMEIIERRNSDLSVSYIGKLYLLEREN